MNALVVGLGSIGMRHARILQHMGYAVTAISARKDVNIPSFAQWEYLTPQSFDIAIIANPTHEHAMAYHKLEQWASVQKILVEKPIFAWETHFLKESERSTTPVWVGYNLRFHPAMTVIRKLLHGKQLYALHFYVGQYLPDWRQNSDYRGAYSAHIAQGGGVLRDLSHELDMACHLAGPWQRLCALGGHISSLEIDSEDSFSLLSIHKNCPQVNIHMNYLHKKFKREWIIQYEDGTISLDLCTHTLKTPTIQNKYNVHADTTYQQQLQALHIGQTEYACTYDQGIDVLHMICAAERAAKEQQWICR